MSNKAGGIGSWLWRFLLVVSGLYVMWLGANTFDDAETWLNAFKGLFWLLVGAWSVISGTRND